MSSTRTSTPSWCRSAARRAVGRRRRPQQRSKGRLHAAGSSWGEIELAGRQKAGSRCAGDFVVDDDGNGYAELGEEADFWTADDPKGGAEGEEDGDEDGAKAGKKRKGGSKGGSQLEPGCGLAFVCSCTMQIARMKAPHATPDSPLHKPLRARVLVGVAQPHALLLQHLQQRLAPPCTHGLLDRRRPRPGARMPWRAPH